MFFAVSLLLVVLPGFDAVEEEEACFCCWKGRAFLDRRSSNCEMSSEVIVRAVGLRRSIVRVIFCEY